jgi:Citrate transporter
MMDPEDTNKTQESLAGAGPGPGATATDAAGVGIRSNPDVIIFPPTQRGIENSIYRQERPMFSPERHQARRQHRYNTDHDAAAPGTANPELMGPILRRKKVVSMPLGLGGDFFVTDDVGGPHRQLETMVRNRNPRERQLSSGSADVGAGSTREKQLSLDGKSGGGRQRQVTPTSPGAGTRRRTKQNSFMDNLVRRKQISLDLLGPNDFFAVPTTEEEFDRPPSSKGEIDAVPEEEELVPEEQLKQDLSERKKKLFMPLRFSPPVILSNKHSNVEHGPSMFATTAPLPIVDEELTKSLHRQSRNSEALKLQLSALQNKIDEEETDSKKKDLFLSVSKQIEETQKAIDEEQKILLQKLEQHDETGAEGSDATAMNNEEVSEDAMKPVVVADEVDDRIVYADKCDKIKAAIVFLIMLAFTVVVCTWDTHVAALSHIYGPVGLACVTECLGNLETRDFFHGHNHFEEGALIQLILNIDANSEADEAHAVVEIVGEETGVVKAVVHMGPVSAEHRLTLDSNVKVDFENPSEHHIINVNSTNPEVELSFTLAAEVKTPLANYSVIVAACIMVVVYAFILVEVIHRTLVAIFGSMLALLFVFIMSGGYTESIKQIMLSMEWSTLGLLFGMMLLVGELSHTGIFEWCAVRLLVASRGSFNLLMVLLGVLTAVASAFLDNVTTMLLVAPVTIDMCSILGVDPRPYLIGEVLLSNVGGTATLIGKSDVFLSGSFLFFSLSVLIS